MPTTLVEYPSGPLRLLDGDVVDPRANRQGNAVVIDQVLQWTLEGKVYNASNVIQETGELAGESTFALANPSFTLDVQPGLTCIPLEFVVGHEGTGSGGDWTAMLLVADDVRTYASGGLQVTPNNMKTHGPPSRVRFFSGATQIVNTTLPNHQDDLLFTQYFDISLHPNIPIIWTYKRNPMPVLVGPASLNYYIDAGDDDNEIDFTFKWAEFSTADLL